MIHFYFTFQNNKNIEKQTNKIINFVDLKNLQSVLFKTFLFMKKKLFILF